MSITVNSPHSGRPVMVRPQDIGRAVRDEEGRIFYVLAKSDGSGHFGSRTRQCDEKQEQAELARQFTVPAPSVQTTVQETFDARGKGHRRWPRIVWLLLFLVIVAGLLFLFSPWGPFNQTTGN